MLIDDTLMTRERKASQPTMTTANVSDRRLPITRDMAYGQMRRAIMGLPIRVMSAILPGDVSALYDDSLHVIVIDRRMTYTQKRCSLVHELFHWHHGDDTCAGTRGGHVEQRTRKETALFLIDPQEYATAETLYNGEPYPMACDLDVTVNVLEDYMRILEQEGLGMRMDDEGGILT